MNKIKALKLAARNYINEITGQQTKIEKYNEITHALASATQDEVSQEKKHQIRTAYEALTEEKWTLVSENTVSIKDFNPYKTFQNKKLTQKIESGTKLLERFNIV